MYSFDGIRAVLAAAAGAMSAAPNAVELPWGGFNKCWLVGGDAGLEVAAAAFHAYSGSCQVGGADIECIEVKDTLTVMDYSRNISFVI